MTSIHEESPLFEYPCIVAGKHPLTHFQGFYTLLLEKLEGFSYAVWFDEFSESFLSSYSGIVICLTPSYANHLCQRPRKCRVVLLDHGPLPTGWRAPEKVYADHLINNGSPELLRRITLPDVKQICTAGYFPTDWFSDERTEGLTLVQVTTHNIARTWQDQCRLSLIEVCETLQEDGFDVCVYNHVMHPSDLDGLPPEIRIVRSGLDYIQTLSTCSHFVFTGTSGFITNIYQPGCHMTAISRDWIGKNSTLFQEVLERSCHVAESREELLHGLSLPVKGGEKLTEFLYGENRRDVIPKINRYLQSLL